LNRRNLAILALCCIPTIAITTVMAYRFAADEPVVTVPAASVPGRDAGLGRLEARPMQPGEPLGQASVVASVSYAGEVARLPEAAMVFIFARVPGQRMPLAVERVAPTRLPVEVVFRHNPGGELEIVARLSLLGGAKLEQGDVETAVQVVAPGEGEKVVALRLPPI
jgi:hypothetical protein